MKRSPLLLALALLAAAATGCGGIKMFTSHHTYQYGNDDNKKRIAELESRVSVLEREQHAPVPAPTAPAQAPAPVQPAK